MHYSSNKRGLKTIINLSLIKDYRSVKSPWFYRSFDKLPITFIKERVYFSFFLLFVPSLNELTKSARLNDLIVKPYATWWVRSASFSKTETF